MSEDASRWCVFIPVSKTETWAVPQICLAEILTLQSSADQPPEEVQWRGRTVPVVDFGVDDGSQWRESQRDSGLVAIFLGLEGEGCEYWAVAVRGDGLAARKVAPREVHDVPDSVVEHATAAFSYHGVVCQVPDLDSLQKTITLRAQVA